METLPVAPQTRRKEQSQPLKVAEIVPIISANLALLRPVGMSEDAAFEWLTVAAGELAHLDAATLRMAAREARTTCTHHGQIIPAILNSKAVSERRAFDALRWADRELAWEERKAQLSDSRPAQKLIESAARSLKA